MRRDKPRAISVFRGVTRGWWPGIAMKTELLIYTSSSRFSRERESVSRPPISPTPVNSCRSISAELSSVTKIRELALFPRRDKNDRREKEEKDSS